MSEPDVFHHWAGGQNQPGRDTGAEPEFPGRRSFLAVLTGVGTVAVGLLLSVPLFRFALYPLFRKTTETGWSDAGTLSNFASITAPAEPVITVRQRDGWRNVVSRKPVYILPPGVGAHRVLSPICPHLGCEVPWVEARKRFVCPCHGSIFGPDGSLIYGPAARGLDYLDSKAQGGRLMVRYEYFRMLVAKREIIG